MKHKKNDLVPAVCFIKQYWCVKGSYADRAAVVEALPLVFPPHQGVMYVIDRENQTCIKKELNSTFHPMEIPENATLLGQVILGSFSAPGEGLLVNSWSGDVPEQDGTHMRTHTHTDTPAVNTETIAWIKIQINSQDRFSA